MMDADPYRLRRHGISLVEVLVCLGILGLLLALLAPAVQSVRERARTLHCEDNLRGLAAAAHMHESFHGAFPRTSSSAADGRSDSPHRYLLFFVNPAVSAAVDMDDRTPPFSDPDVPASSNSDVNRTLLDVNVAEFVCPSDSARPGSTNYRANMGPTVQILLYDVPAWREPSARSGAFVHDRAVSVAEFTDGTSMTALFSERIVGDGNARAYDPFRDLFSPPAPYLLFSEDAMTCADSATANPPATFSFMGSSWLIGGFLHTWYNHVSGPNSRIPDCANGGGWFTNDGGRGVFSARSFHPGGVNVAIADGSVRFVADSIALDLWRALGSRNLGD